MVSESLLLENVQICVNTVNVMGVFSRKNIRVMRRV